MMYSTGGWNDSPCSNAYVYPFVCDYDAVSVLVLTGPFIADGLSGCSILTSLTIPSSVTSVEYLFIAGSNNLSTIVAPTSLNLEPALTGCQQLVENTAYNVAGMKQYTLQTLTSVTIPVGSTSIKAAQYYGCPIVSVTIPSSIVSINSYAFSYSSLVSLNIPTSIMFIGIAIIIQLIHSITFK